MPSKEEKQQMSRYEHLCAKLSSLHQKLNLFTTLVDRVNLVGDFLVLTLNAQPPNKPDFINRMCFAADDNLGGDWTILKSVDDTIVLRRRAVKF